MIVPVPDGGFSLFNGDIGGPFSFENGQAVPSPDDAGDGMLHAGVLVRPLIIRVVKLYGASILARQLPEYIGRPLAPFTAFDQMRLIFDFVYQYLFGITADGAVKALYRKSKTAKGLALTKAFVGERFWYITKGWIPETVPPKTFLLHHSLTEPFIQMISNLFDAFKTTSNRNSERSLRANNPNLEAEWSELLKTALNSKNS